MTKNEGTNKGSINFGEIGTIRNILMGEQMTQYEQKFRELEATVHTLKQDLQDQILENSKRSGSDVMSLKSELEDQIQSQSDRMDSDIYNLKTEISTQLTALSANVEEKSASLEEKIIIQNESHRKELGAFFIEFGQKMLKS